MNFLIMGGAGSVGNDLTASLLRKGHKVKVFDRKTRTAGAVRDDRLEWIEGQLEDARLVQEAIRGVDVVIHLAARVHVMKDTAIDALAEFRRINVERICN